MTDAHIAAGLDSADPEQRRLIVAGLLDARGPGALQQVIRALGDEDWRVRKEAIAVVIEMGAAPELLTALIGTFSTSDDVGLRNAVSEALAGFGQPAVIRLSEEMQRLDADGRKLAAEALGRTGHSSAVAVLSQLVSDPDMNVRVAAIEALGCVGGAETEAVAPVLVGALVRGDVLERLAALEAINALGIAVAWAELAPLVNVPVLERAALQAAAHINMTDVAVPLVAALARQARFGETWPVIALAEYVSQDHRLLVCVRAALQSLQAAHRDFLLRLTESEESDVRAAALVTLSALGDAGASRCVLDAAERDEVTGLADQLLFAIAALEPSVLLERLRGEAVGQRALVLRMAARHPNSIDREILLEQAASVIQHDRDPAFSAALELLSVLSNEECLRRLVKRFPSLPVGLRRTAAVVLSEMALRHPEVARACIEAGPFEGERWLAVTVMLAALARGGQPTSQSDMELLTRCLLAEDASVRCAALDALSAFGDAAAADAIAFSLADEELEVRMAAVRALGRLRGEGESASVIGRLIDLAQRTDDRQLLVVAVQAIGETSDPRVLSVLRPLVRSNEPSVAVAAVEAIGLVSDARRLEALLDALTHPDVEVVKAAMGSLARESDVRVEVHLGACLDHDAWDVRRLAADLLGQRGGEVALGLLRAKHGSEREPLVKEALERALALSDGVTPARRSSAAPRQGSWRPR
jgi:HEAT repeat protein